MNFFGNGQVAGTQSNGDQSKSMKLPLDNSSAPISASGSGLSPSHSSHFTPAPLFTPPSSQNSSSVPQFSAPTQLTPQFQNTDGGTPQFSPTKLPISSNSNASSFQNVNMPQGTIQNTLDLPGKNPFDEEFMRMMNEMGVHPVEQREIMTHPERHLDEIQRIRERIKKKKEEAKRKGEEKKEFSSVRIQSKEESLTMADVLDAMVEYEASDLHLAANSQIAMRVKGAMHFIENIPQLTREQGERLILSMVPTDAMKETLLRTRELDLSFEHTDGTFFRVNIFYKRKNMATVMRRIASEALPMEKLGLPPGVLKVLKAKQGLILVTGPTGSGKSTSMQSMLDYINATRVEHILTIEDPVEFVFTNKKSVFSQREVGGDTLSFANALKGALRQDPDVVMIGEMRDPETIMAAINLSETGHLVISTLHTSGAPQTVSRVLNAFPPDQQHQVQSRLADTLIGVLSQRLVPTADRKSRRGIYELMLVNAAIRNIIRTGDMSQIYNAIQAGQKEGMIRMEKYAQALADEGIIKEEDYMGFFREE